MLRYWTAGESHGKGHLAFLDSFPAGVCVDKLFIDGELKRRQSGYGRGDRQKIEADSVEVLTGMWLGITTGGPVTLWVKNQDHKIDLMGDLEAPRPGHGDLAGSIKYHTGIRPILERSSARATTATVAAGALAKLLLAKFDITVTAYVVGIGELSFEPQMSDAHGKMVPMPRGATGYSTKELIERRNASEFFSLRDDLEDEAKRLIDRCRDDGNSLGGMIEIRVDGVPFGLGTHAQWDLKLDGRLSQAIMAMQAIKGVEIGLGFEVAKCFGQQVHDPIGYDSKRRETRSFGFFRTSNNAGGIEAGMSNSEPIVIRVAKKPIATLKTALPSVDLSALTPKIASYERSDVCAVPAASVVLEAIVALEMARALTEKFGCDSLDEMKAFYDAFRQMTLDRLDQAS